MGTSSTVDVGVRAFAASAAAVVLTLLAIPSTSDSAEPAVDSTVARPTVSGSLTPALQYRPGSAFALAVQRIESVAECSRLFAALRADGRTLLSRTRYGEAQKRCSGEAVALTAVGSPVTLLCPSFARLSIRGAAAILIHESLHFAGLPERPPEPGAMDSREINGLVKRKCQL